MTDGQSVWTREMMMEQSGLMTRRFRKATLREVAEHTGVSQTTISKFVGGREDICSAQTAERIREAIATLNYVPGRATRGLRDRATHTIGVCMVMPFDVQRMEPTWFAEWLWPGISQEADARNYTLLYYPSAVRNGKACDPFLDGRVDGLIFRPDRHDVRPATLVRAGLPLVLLARSRSVPAGCGTVYADEGAGVELALSHLWELGHRRIAHLAGPSLAGPSQIASLAGPSPVIETWTRDDDISAWRRDAYGSWMQARGVFDPALLASIGSWDGAIHEARVETALRAWQSLAEKPTAVFCANDSLAWSVLCVARRLNWRVPGELSVVGVDNWPPSVECDPPLSSVEVPLETIGREAARLLFGLMSGEVSADAGAARVCVPVTKLVVRDSTAPPSR